jgi:hypothetical protein
MSPEALLYERSIFPAARRLSGERVGHNPSISTRPLDSRGVNRADAAPRLRAVNGSGAAPSTPLGVNGSATALDSASQLDLPEAPRLLSGRTGLARPPRLRSG